MFFQKNDVEMILEFKKLCSYFGFQKCFLFSFFKGSSIPEIWSAHMLHVHVWDTYLKQLKWLFLNKPILYIFLVLNDVFLICCWVMFLREMILITWSVLKQKEDVN